jgi:hypothetical protein
MASLSADFHLCKPTQHKFNVGPGAIQKPLQLAAKDRLNPLVTFVSMDAFKNFTPSAPPPKPSALLPTYDFSFGTSLLPTDLPTFNFEPSAIAPSPFSAISDASASSPFAAVSELSTPSPTPARETPTVLAPSCVAVASPSPDIASSISPFSFDLAQSTPPDGPQTPFFSFLGKTLLETETKFEEDSKEKRASVKFPYEEVLKSLNFVYQPNKIKKASPITADHIKVIEVFFDLFLPVYLKSSKRQEFRAGYVFKYRNIKYKLCRTIEIIENLDDSGKTPYLLLNRTVNHKTNESLDPIIGSGSYKVAKFCINLFNGQLYSRATLLDSHEGNVEINQLKTFNGNLGILSTIGILRFNSKYLDKNKNIRKKIALISPYYPEGDLFKFISKSRLQKLYPDISEQQKQRINLVRSGLVGLKFLHSGLQIAGEEASFKIPYIHRDIKPANFLVSRETNTLSLKLFDFGMVKFEGFDKQASGSPNYFSPEAIEKFVNHELLPYFPPHDMWAFGMTVFNLKYGHFPAKNGFNKASKGNQLSDISSFLMEKIKEWRAGTRISLIDEEDLDSDDPLDVIAANCLLMDPSKRFTAQEALKYLDSCETEQHL